MKYIDTEKLIAEIRKLCSESCISEEDEYYEYAKSEIIDIIDSLQQEQTEEHPDNFTSFEWLIGRLMFRGCDLWGMTDGEDDNGVVTKLIKDRAAEMMELLERELDPNAEPVDLEKEAEEYADKHGFRVPYDGSNNFYDDVDVKASLEGFKAGAKWMAEQMKRDSK